MKVLIVGLGSIAKKHIEALFSIDKEVEIYALRSKGALNEVKGVNNLYNLSEIDFKIDFAIISNPTSSHAKSIKDLIEFQIPLFIEKPLFDSLKPLDVIYDVNKKGIRTYVGCNLRFLDCIKEIRGILFEERINEVSIYCGSYLPSWRPGVDFKKSYSANKELGGGVHIDLIHEIDYAVWLFGFPQQTSKVFNNKSSLEITAFDYAHYFFEYATFSLNINLNYYRKIPKRIIEIVCKENIYEVDLLKNRIIKNGILFFESEQKISDTYKQQMDFFISEIIPGNELNFNNIDEAYKILKLCLED